MIADTGTGTPSQKTKTQSQMNKEGEEGRCNAVETFRRRSEVQVGGIWQMDSLGFGEPGEPISSDVDSLIPASAWVGRAGLGNARPVCDRDG
jgi:hypothetical protein